MKKTLAAALLAALLFCGCATLMDAFQNLRVPDFFHPPKLEITGAPIDIGLALKPLQVTARGEAKIERIDEHVIKLTSASGHLRIPLEKGELIYGLTFRLVADRILSESQLEEIGGLNRRGEIVNMWEIPSFAAYIPFYVSSRGYGLWISGWDPGVYDLGKTDPDLLDLGFYPGPAGFTCYFITGDSYPDILDRADEYNPSGKNDIYFNGQSGFQLHNQYPLLYIKAYFEAAKSVRGDDFLILARPAQNATTTMSINWGGDTPGSLPNLGQSLQNPKLTSTQREMIYAAKTVIPRRGRGTDLGLRAVIIEIQRMAFLGFPTWGSDTGGYVGFKDREVFARWLELSCFCPLMEIGGIGPHEPWAMPFEPKYDEEMIHIFHRYTWIHQRLADYTYALAEKGHETGDPIVHPLVFDWPDDPKVADRWDEYLYGPALLIAPIWKKGVTERDVYLPTGKWSDFWDPAKTFTGPTTIHVQVPLDKIAVFVRTDKVELLPANLIEGL